MNTYSADAPARIKAPGSPIFDTPMGLVFSLFLIASILVGLFSYAISFAWSEIEGAPELFGLCIAIGFLALFGLLRAMARKEALQFISFLFCFLFFSIAPIAQIAVDDDPVFRMKDYSIIAAIGSMIFVLMGLVLGRRPTASRAKPSRITQVSFNFTALALLTAASGAAGLFILRNILFSSRAGFGTELLNTLGDSQTSLIVQTGIQVIPFFGAVLGLRQAWRAKSWGWTGVFLVLFALGCTLNNPIITARFRVAGLALGVIDYFFSGRRSTLLAVCLVVGIVVAPAFNVFREDHGLSNFQENLTQGNWFQQSFISMDYDGFETASYTAMLVSQYGSQACSNLLGAALFFVPRSVWPDKPVPTAWILAYLMKSYRYVGTANLSTPLPAEAFYAFGWTGLLVISYVYWAGLRKLHERSLLDDQSATFLVRSVIVGLVLILLRGTLIVGISSIASNIVAALLPFYVAKIAFGASTLHLAADPKVDMYHDTHRVITAADGAR